LNPSRQCDRRSLKPLYKHFELLVLHVKSFYKIKSNIRLPSEQLQTPEQAYDCVWTVMSATSNQNDNIKLMKGKALRKHSLHEKTAASVLLKLFISGNEWCHTTDAPYRMSRTPFSNVNNIHVHSMIHEDQKNMTTQWCSTRL